MRAIVTGAAGFIGFNLCKTLLSAGWNVTGVDAFRDYYSTTLKRKNAKDLLKYDGFSLIESEISEVDWDEMFGSHEYVFHLAGQPGVRASWGKSFNYYIHDNISATQIMLEAASKAKNIRRFVYASTSSIYGNAESFPTSERTIPRPVSPYGVTKLAAENLCHLYWVNYKVPTVSLRFFTVYGPGQRPDMAFHRILKALYSGDTFQIYGDGHQTRDFTFVSDIVSGIIAASSRGKCGRVYNLGGGHRVSLLEVIEELKSLTSRSLNIQFKESQKGDARDTSADISLASEELGYVPQVFIRTGLQLEKQWFESDVLGYYTGGDFK